ncbi:YciI family protein [Nocardioides taihuensis]|uniref:YciI family protein n=1 Tax=Nocardioides taihuensis TaxID=1835606 RepID=A0ABW0BEU8_9ACTN
MRYLLLLSEEDPGFWSRADEAERAALMDAHVAFDAAVRERGHLVAGEALADAASTHTLRTVGGHRVLTEGPYAESVEQLGSFYLVDADDLATVEQLVRVLPDHYAIEVRPVVRVGGYDYGERG